MAKRLVQLHIGGQRYSVKSDADETYVRVLAGHVDEQLQEVGQSSRAVPTQKLLVLAALTIADELFSERRKRAELKRRVKEKSQEVLAYLDRVSKQTKKAERALTHPVLLRRIARVYGVS